ncbi:MAG: PQQ-binding-like beta-propeller repeat protein [Anaerolineae bacterium]|nr:PQQ-binding-like beta-propeller repeat protein [Anaerolineae bacterium]MDW8067676.1 PQQ-binding-like beta-propeller repeat protein [Anaerolineae bacterium]
MNRPLFLSTALALTLVLLLAGCSGGVHPTTWTTLMLHNGTLYVADLEQVRALDAETGQQDWAFPDPPDLSRYGPFYTVALLNDELLLVTSYESSGGLFSARSRGVLRALALNGGRLVWPQPFIAGGEFVAPGAAGAGIFVIGNSDGNIYGLRIADGTLAWQYPTRGRVWATPLVISDTVYVASLDHHLYALDLQTGARRWQFRAGGAMADRPLPLDDTLYIGSFDRNLYALRRADGAEIWRFTGANWFWGTPASDGNRLYAADVDGNVYALDAATGQEIWRSQVAGTVRLGPALSPDGKRLLVASENGTLFGLDTADGFVLWQQAGQGQIGSMVIGGEKVYVTRINAPQRVQSFYVENGRPIWSYPPPQR